MPWPPPLFVETHSGHGRVEERRLHAFAVEPMTADFPFARSLIVVRSQRTVKRLATPPPKAASTFRAVGQTNTGTNNGWDSSVGTGAEWKYAITGGATLSWARTAHAAATPTSWPTLP